MRPISFSERNPAPESGTVTASSAGGGHAHGKVILIGEHTVVYESAAVALPLTGADVTARARFADDRPVPVGPAAPMYEGIADAVRTALREWDRTGRGVRIDIDCRIPRGRGLGTSAATAVAALRATADLCRVRPSRAELARFTQIAEQVNHGRASGVDAATALSRGPLVFRSGHSHPAAVGAPLYVVIADTGVAGSTADAVARVAVRLAHTSGSGARVLARAKSIVEAAVADLAAGRIDALGRRLVDFHAVLSELGVSTPQLDDLVAAALGAGAAGAKLTGGGLGGCLVAVAGTEPVARRVARTLRTAGAVDTWQIPVEGVCR